MNFTNEEIKTMKREASEFIEAALCGFGHVTEKPYRCMECKHYDSAAEMCYPNSRDAEKEIAISSEEAEKFTMLGCDFFKGA